MANLRTIRNIDDETWDELKGLSKRYRTPIGRLIGRMIKGYKMKGSSVWDMVLKHETLLSKDEAKKMHDVVKKLRSEYGFRK